MGHPGFHGRDLYLYHDHHVLMCLVQGEEREKMVHFFRVLALCHTVIPEWVDEIKKVVYRASSPGQSNISNVSVIQSAVGLNVQCMYVMYVMYVFMYVIPCTV